MKNLLEELLKEKEKCRWRENGIAGDVCVSVREFECFFLSDNSYLIAGTKLCKCDYMHLKLAYQKELNKE